ncbi:pseudouridine synthase [Clostridium paraputrificum]|uniref:pseudouridine synthase n=1 Tax=Clostridium paraputrificum TaxID=29363 RepID=UPI0003FA87FB|nr:pseudouridine synthase [Clostridium paraputrificum]MDB2106597.1 pseudouridine synthase [Clostridium paraputrificum]MDB2113310.1 pseudouridine synthase [Clostridium paraputrificum]
MRINKLLSNYGYCSRKEANKLIQDKRVIVNGELAIEGQWVEETDTILLDNVRVKPKDKVYVAFNKPVGIVCTAAKETENNIIDYIDYPEYIFPIGRLDKPSQGLILLTNDGELADKILSAENYHEKEYIVEVDKDIDDEFILNMSNGIKIWDRITRKCQVKALGEKKFSIILTEGMNRQIRKMCKSLGYEVTFLKRIRIMNVLIDGIEEGKWRNLSIKEINTLKNG